MVNVLDPAINPVLASPNRRVKNTLEQLGLRRATTEQVPHMIFHSSRFIDKALEHAGFAKDKGMTRGFTPFSLMRRRVLPTRMGIRLHLRLQRLANRDVLFFRSTGMAYFAQARKLALQPFVQSTCAEKVVSGSIKAL